MVKLRDATSCWMMSQILQKKNKKKLREEIPGNHLPLEKKTGPPPQSTTQKKKGREVMELGCASNLVTI